MASLSDSIASFQAFTGTSEQEATMYLEMGGGNVEIAVGLFFGGGSAGGFGGGGEFSFDATPTSTASKPDWFQIIWGSNEPASSWTEQPLTFDPAATDEVPYSHLGLVQIKNGPCGVLAALNAVMVRLLIMESNSANSSLSPTIKPTDELLSRSIAHLMSAPNRADKSSSIQCGVWDAAADGGVSFQSFEKEQDATAFILSNLDHYVRPGGLLLICYSAVLSRGGDQVRRDVSTSGGEVPLIFGTFNLCTSELMSLLLRGCGDGNVGSYGPVGGKKIDWSEHTPVGMLSYNEIDHSIPVCDRLKSPGVPVWILHGRDHFTFLFLTKTEREEKEEEEEKKTTEEMEMFHFNGLPPAGPRMTRLSVVAKNGAVGPAPDSHKEGVGTFFTPKINTIFDVVQSHPEDKKERPKSWKTWRYEVVLHVEDADGKLYGKGEDYSEEQGPVSFSQEDGIEHEDGRWRCSRCYVKRNETMAFKMNDSGSETCMHCGGGKGECGWTMWMRYEQLPTGWQGSMNRRYQPKITTLLGTKWPSAEVNFDDEENPPSI